MVKNNKVSKVEKTSKISSPTNTLRIVDLFAGLGGTRLGVEQALDALKIKHVCVMSCDNKKTAQSAYKLNFKEPILGDIRQIKETDVPDHDILIGGFPCQAFSRAGKKRGFADTRGTLFFEIERILREKKPQYILLENVPELLTHDKGRTIEVIKKRLEDIGYTISIDVLSADQFGCPQARRRAFITGVLDGEPADFSMIEYPSVNARKTMKDIMEKNVKPLKTEFTKALLSNRKAKDIRGFVISDKRRGDKTLHSWDIELFGKISKEQKNILETILSEFRRRKWAEELEIKWRDGMPLNMKQISKATGITQKDLKPMLEDLVEKGYLIKRYPYCDDSLSERTDLPIGYKLVTSRVSFELNRFLGPDDVCVTLTATDASHIGIIDGRCVRRLTKREMLRLFGFPETYSLECVTDKEAYDLCGNSICIPVVKAVAKQLLKNAKK